MDDVWSRFLSFVWIYTDPDSTATIHSRFSWDFLPPVAQVKTKRSKVSGLIRVVVCTAPLSFTISAAPAIFYQVIHTLSSYHRNIK